jgi:hypothetical protein
MTPLQRTQLDFWTEFCDYASKNACRITPTAPQPDSCMPIAAGTDGFGLNAIASTHHWDGSKSAPGLGIRAEFVIFNAKHMFTRLRNEQDRIQAQFGEGHLIWLSQDRVKQCKIFLQQRIDWQDPSKRQQCYEWLVRNLDKVHEVFGPLARGPGIPECAKLLWHRIRGKWRWTKDV